MNDGLLTRLLDVADGFAGLGANWLVQSSLLLLVGLFIARLLRSRGPAVQSVVYRTTLVAAILCPLTSWTLSLTGIAGWSINLPAAWSMSEPRESTTIAGKCVALREDVEAPSDRAETFPATSFTIEGSDTPMAYETPSEPIAPPGEPLAITPTAQALSQMVENTPEQHSAVEPVASTTVIHRFGVVVLGTCMVWVAVTIMLLIQVLVAYRRLCRLRSSAMGAEADTLGMCRRVASLMGIAAPEVKHSPYLPSPCLAGLRRPTVLLPETTLAMGLRDVLIHELAHLRRHDCHWRLVCRLATAVGFFQPLLWILVRRLQFVAEEVCDDYVVQHGGDRRAYANALVDIARLSMGSPATVGIGIVSFRSMLGRRITRIVDTSRTLSTRAGYIWLTLVLAGGLLCTTAAGLVGSRSRAVVSETETAASERAQDTNGPGSMDEGPISEMTNTTDESADSIGQPNEEITGYPVEGQVVDMHGQPVAGAELYWFRSRVHDLKPMAPRLLAKADREGLFRFEPPSLEIGDDVPAGWDYFDNLVIRALGHGPKLTSLGSLLRQSNESEIKLADAGGPIHGRIVDAKGRPIAGAKVRIRWLSDHDAAGYELQEAKARGDGPDDEWRIRIGRLVNVIEPVQLRDVLPSAVTDADGRFELRDVGAGRFVQLLVEGDGIESTEILAREQQGETIVSKPGKRFPQGPTYTLHGPRFECMVRQSRPIAGQVVDLDTGKPIADAVVRAFALAGSSLHSSRELQHFATVTDAEGRYRIEGMPIGKGNMLVAFTTGDVPYLPVGFQVDTSKSEPATRCNFRLKRGVWAEGRVFDAETDVPFTGEIEYFYFRNKQLDKAIPGLRGAYLDGRYWTNSNGEFRVPVVSSVRGILAYRYDGRNMNRDGIERFPRGFGAESIKGAKDFGGGKGFPTEPYYLYASNYNRVAEVQPAKGQETVRVDMSLLAGRSVYVYVVDVDENPVMQYEYYGATDAYGWRTHHDQFQEHGTGFEVEAIKQGERRKVFVYDRARDLAGSAIIDHKSGDDVTIRLGPAGRVTGRLVEANGKQIADATLQEDCEVLVKQKDSAIWAPHADLKAMPTHIPVDAEGRFELVGLIPGWKYTAWVSAPRNYRNLPKQNLIIGHAFTNMTVKPGENKNLGDLKIQPPEPRETCKQVKKKATATPQSRQLSKYVKEVLDWLPVDTETLIVARDFKLGDPPKDPLNADGKMHIDLLFPQGLTVWPLPGPMKTFINKRPIRWAVHGGCNYEGVSSFGTYFYEGASVIRFAERLSNEEQEPLSESLRNEAKEVRSVAGHKVFVFPPDFSGAEGGPERYKNKTWLGEYIVLLGPKTIITATSDRYLAELLSRIGKQPARRALADTLPEWKHVDCGANIWFLRHVPDTCKQRYLVSKSERLRGLVWMFYTDRIPFCRFVYLPKPGHRIDKTARQPWGQLEKSKTPPLSEKFKALFDYQTAPDGTVTFTFPKLAGKQNEGKPQDNKQLTEQLKREMKNEGAHMFFFLTFWLYGTQGIGL